MLTSCGSSASKNAISAALFARFKVPFQVLSAEPYHKASSHLPLVGKTAEKSLVLGIFRTRVP
jgi:hypothetical protein